ncbi:hypothetical protein MMC20_001928 [Loxospora ochrophaea]|nr:hypothetical protein [Loxospora ochrophaea]
MAASPKIAIAGAGPAGLTLANILQRNGVSVTIFEREVSPEARANQGGTLDLHETSGQRAMKEAGLIDQFKKHCRYEGEDIVIADKTGHVHFERTDEQRGRPEIDRAVLRQILLDNLSPDTVSWNRNLRKVEPGTLHFEKSSETGFDLIVGADGAWSKVTPLLTTVRPFYSGISGVEIRFRDVQEKYPAIDKLVGRGSYFAFDNEGLFCQRQGDDTIRIYAVFKKPENWVKESGINFDNAPGAREAILREYSEWAPHLQDLVRYCDDDIIPRALYMLPVGLRWHSHPNVTVMGDAAHLMTPFAGEGVNMAMQDAVELAEAIVEHKDDMAAAIRQYEIQMFARNQRAMQKTWDNLMDRFQPDGAASFRAMVDRMMQEHKQRPGLQTNP